MKRNRTSENSRNRSVQYHYAKAMPQLHYPCQLGIGLQKTEYFSSLISQLSLKIVSLAVREVTVPITVPLCSLGDLWAVSSVNKILEHCVKKQFKKSMLR